LSDSLFGLKTDWLPCILEQGNTNYAGYAIAFLVRLLALVKLRVERDRNSLIY